MEHLVYLVGVLHVQTDTVVRHGEDPFMAVHGYGYVDLRTICIAELYGIVVEVLHQLEHLRPVGIYGWRLVDTDFNLLVLD